MSIRIILKVTWSLCQNIYMYLNHVGIHMKSSSLKFLSDMQNDDHTKLAYFAQLKNKYI